MKKQHISTAIRFIGWAWVVIAMLVIALSYIVIGVQQGLSEVLSLMNPFNLLNFLATVLALAPGIGLILLADRLQDKPDRMRP